MWPFSTKRMTLADSGVFQGFTEHHCHLLPGVDDGVRTMDETLALLADYEQLGFTTVWFTPHIMEDVPNTTAQLRDRFAEVQAAYKGNLSLHLAAENMMDSLFQERLDSRDVLPLGTEGDHLLVETSYFTPPMGMIDILDRVKSMGFHPVLAHPERYVYMERKEYDQMREMGVRLQLNLFSMAGSYGETAQRKAQKLLAAGYYSITGTDTHSHRFFRHVIKSHPCLTKRQADDIKRLVSQPIA